MLTKPHIFVSQHKQYKIIVNIHFWTCLNKQLAPSVATKNDNFLLADNYKDT